MRIATVLCGATAACGFVLAAGSAFAADFDKDVCRERIAPALQQEVDEGVRAGFVAAVATEDGVLCQVAVGMADIEGGEVMTTRSRFRIASMTKPVVSAAVMQLVDRGAILLDDPISRHIPAFADPQVAEEKNRNGDGEFETRPAAREITVHDLLTHMSGVGYVFSTETDLDRAYSEIDTTGEGVTLEGAVNALAALPLYEDPGTVWRYSYATDILGRLVEVASGETLETYLRDNIFAPLGMDDTEFFLDETDFERLAVVYAFDEEGEIGRYEGDGLGINVNETPFTIMSGGAGLISTAEDYAAFATMLLNGGAYRGAQILSPLTVSLMMSDHTPASARPDEWNQRGQTFGLGGLVILEPGMTGRVAAEGEWGWGGYWDTWFIVNRRDNVAAVLLTQNQPNALSQPSRARNLVKSVVYGAAQAESD